MKNEFGQPTPRKQKFVGSYLLLLLAACLFNINAAAQTVVVKFINEHNGKPFANERVLVYFSDPKPKGSFDLKTDREGKVQFESDGAKAFEVVGIGLIPCEARRDFSIEEILTHGIVTRNDCGHANVGPQRGQLIIVARHATWWELFKN